MNAVLLAPPTPAEAIRHRTQVMVLQLVKQAFADWKDDKCARLAAALAFYTAVSLAPLLVITVAVAGFFLGDDAARGEVVGQFQGFLGREGASAVQTVLKSSHQGQGGVIATIVGVVVLLVGASAVFGELKAAFNTVWEVPDRKAGGLKGMLKGRILSFAMIMAVAFLLLVSLVISTVLTAAGSFFSERFGDWPIFWQAVNLVVGLGVTTVLFALMFKILPDTKIPWRDVWIGALATAALFTVGKYLIGLYLARGTATSPYGAAGSVVAMLIWVYYSAQILFFGAELTQAYAYLHGSRAQGSPARGVTPHPTPNPA